jgi:Protein of unknown function (DUF3800)
MKLCYVDESGKAETLTPADAKQQPVVVIGGISLPEEALTAVTHEWIELKSRFYPGLNSRGQKGWLDGILHDPKGASLRRGFRARASKRQRKHAVGLIDGTLKLLERHGGEVLGRIWLKELSAPNDDMKIHTSSLHFICSAFQAGLRDDERGMVVVDSQTYQHNFRLAHSMFTQRFGKKSAKQRLVDMPVFGHSDNHAGLQIADLLCSAVLAPIACSVYGGAYRSWNTHCDPCFLDIRETFGGRLERLTYEWHNARLGRDSSSVVVHDPNTKRPTRLMWSPNSRRPRGPKQQSLKAQPKSKPRGRRRGKHRKVASG